MYVYTNLFKISFSWIFQNLSITGISMIVKHTFTDTIQATELLDLGKMVARKQN